MAASRDGDHATTGRCSNNLGIISNLRGRHAEAIGSWQIAAAAFDRMGMRQGVAECHHNLGISYREQGELDQALTEADHAIADAAGDRTLLAMALCGRAETHVVSGELRLAREDLDRVRELRRGLLDTVGEAEDLRVFGLLLAADGQAEAAKLAIREAMARAEPHGRPHLLAEATRDLCARLRSAGRTADAQAAARKARALFARLGAEGEIGALPTRRGARFRGRAARLARAVAQGAGSSPMRGAMRTCSRT